MERKAGVFVIFGWPSSRIYAKFNDVAHCSYFVSADDYDNQTKTQNVIKTRNKAKKINMAPLPYTNLKCQTHSVLTDWLTMQMATRSDYKRQQNDDGLNGLRARWLLQYVIHIVAKFERNQ